MKNTMIVAVLLSIGALDARAADILVLKLLGNQTQTTVTGTGSDRDGAGAPAYGVEYLHELTRYVDVGAEIDHLVRGEMQSTALLNGAVTTVSGKTTAGMGIVRLNLLPDEKVKPFIAGGVGLASSSLKAVVRPAAGMQWAGGGTEPRTFVDSQAPAVAFAARAGVDVNFGAALVVGAEIGYMYLTSSSRPLTDVGIKSTGVAVISGPQSAVTFGARAGLRF